MSRPDPSLFFGSYFDSHRSIEAVSAPTNKEQEMKAGSVWFGVVLVAVGVCGYLDAAGVVDSAQTIGQWWPLAIVGWPLVEMAAAKRVTLGGAICAAVGVTLLADVQAWASDVVVWSSLAAFVGAAILVSALSRRERRNGDSPENGRPVNGNSLHGATS
jgi:hypothetical protein